MIRISPLMFGTMFFALLFGWGDANIKAADRSAFLPITLVIEPGETNHVFFPNEKKSLDVTVQNKGAEALEATVDLVVLLDNGESQQQDQRVSLPPGGEKVLRFDLDLPGPCFAECRVSVRGLADDTLGTIAVVRPPQIDDLPFQDVFYGVHIMEHPATAKRVGIRFVRALLYWRWTERQKGRMNFSDEAEKARSFLTSGIGYIWTLEPNLPEWIDLEHMVQLNRPEPLKLFSNWVETCVKALPHERMAIEFNNEPDISMGRTNLVSEDEAARSAADLLKTGYRLTKEVNPDIPVLGGGGSGEASRTDGFAHKLLEYADGDIDYYSAHPYTHARYILPDGSVIWPDQYMDTMLEQNAELALKYTKEKALWSTEVGWGYPMDETYLSPASKDFAAITAQGLVLFKTVDHVGKVAWFRGYQHTLGINERGYDYSLFVQSGKGMRPTTGVSAFATVSSLLEGSETGRKLDLGPALRAYLFENKKTGQIVAALWTTRYDVSAKSPAPPEVAVIDHYGRTHPFDSWVLSRAPMFLVTSMEQRTTLENYLKDTQWVPEQAFVISNIGFEGNDRWNLVIESLLLDSTVANVKIGEHVHSVTLNPGENRLQLPFDESSVAGSKIDLDFDISGKETATRSRFAKPLIPVSYLKDADLLLAQPAPLQSLPVDSQVLDDRKYLWPPDPAIPWGSPSDLSVRYGYAWNEKGIYAVYQVNDDRHVGATDHSFWNFDSVQIAIDPATRGGKSGYQPGQRELGLWLDNEGKVHIAQCYPARNDPPEIPSRVTPFEGGVVYEIFLPWRYLFGRETHPTPGSVLAMNFLVNDNDGSGRKCWMSFADGIGTGKIPAVYPWLRLEPKAD